MTQKGQKVTLTITPRNHDGSIQGNPVVIQQVTPAQPGPGEASKVTMYECKLTQPDGGFASVSVGVTVYP